MEKMTVEILTEPADLNELLSVVGSGIEIVLTKDHTPVARLLPIESSSTARIAGLHPGAMSIREDFNAPLPEAFWVGTK